MKKKYYEKPETAVLELNIEQILTGSLPDAGDDNGDGVADAPRRFYLLDDE